VSARDFWAPFEDQIDSFAGLVSAIDRVMEKALESNIQFAWRGQVNADWALHSSLYRRVCRTHGRTVIEHDLASEELKILIELHRWGLHCPASHGRLSVLRQLAMLQHYGAPTRLIDITFNAWVGAWFAVEPKWENGERVERDSDARLFAIDVTDRLINEDDDYRNWEDEEEVPWASDFYDPIDPREWTTSVFAWKPSALDARISAQNGGFLLGGVPATMRPDTKSPFQFPRTPDFRDGAWKIEEGREACCIAARPHKFGATRGVAGHGALYTFRIASKAKQDILDRLEKMFGYRHSTIYPDYSGFASFATTWLKRY
jgi:hypothetical protein